MEKQVFNFKSSQLSEEQRTVSSLNVLLGVESCALLLSDPLNRPMIIRVWHFDNESGAFEEAEPFLRRFLAAEEHDLHSNSLVRVALSNKNVSIVPNRMFDPNQLDVHFKLQLRNSALLCKSTLLAEENCHLVYGADAPAWNLIRQYFPKANVQHLSVCLIKFWRKLAHENGMSVFANFRNQQVQVAAFEHKHLLFYNTFDFQKPSDALYFALLPFEQCKINISETPLQISGNIVADSDLYRLLSRYIQHLRFVSVSNVQLPSETAGFPEHFWVDLLGMNV